MRLTQPIKDQWSRTPPTNGRLQEPAILGLSLVPQRRCMRSISTLWGGLSSGWLLSAAAATCCLAAHARWRRHQNLWVQSGACAAAAPLPAHSQPQVNRHPNCLASRLHHAGSTAVEYVYLKNPRSSACDSGQSSGYRTADLLLFFHGGLCGSDQLLASALRFPPSIQHFLLPNRLGYLRSDPPPPWVDELRQPQPVRGRGRRGEKNELEFAAVYRHRMRSQAALFEDLVRQQIRNLSTNSLGEPQLHLLGVGEGCAHAIIYASCFPRRVRSLVLLGPLLELREHSENGPLENLILKRIRVYRQLTSRLPAKAFKPSLPPPRISFLEWLAAGFSQAAPKTALSNLLQLIGYPTSDRGAFLSSEQLLAALQQQQPMQQQLLLQPRSESSSEGHLRTHGNEGASWRMQQQEAWERQREVYRQLVLRLQHLTGSCCLQHRLLGFLEDALILTAHVGGAASENQRSKLLLQDLEQLQVPAGLVVLAGGSQDSHYPFFQTLEKSRWDVLELPEASPKTLLLSHADLLNSKLHEFYLRCSL